MKRLQKTMLVLCVMGLLVLSSGVALGIKGPVNLNGAANYTTGSTANATTSATVTGTPTDTAITPIDTTTRPIVTETNVVPTLPKETTKSPGFEVVLTIGTLSAIYIFGKFGKRR